MGLATVEAVNRNKRTKELEDNITLQHALRWTTDPTVFFDIAIDESKKGRIVMQLCADVVPKFAETVRRLCTGEGSCNTFKGVTLRAYPGFAVEWQSPEIIQDSDIESRNALKQHGPGVLAMGDPNQNRIQFLIRSREATSINRKHIVFGYAILGMDIVQKIEALGDASNGFWLKEGILKRGKTS